MARRPRDPEDLRGAALRLTARFTALVLVVLVVVGGVVFAIVSSSIAEASEHALRAATQLDSRKDAASGTFVTIVDTHSGGQIVASESMPDGLLDTAAIQSVEAGGGDQRSERTVDGRTYALLTTADGDHDRVIQVAIDQRDS